MRSTCCSHLARHTKGIPKGRFFWFVFYAMILVLALKHAEGESMSLCCDVICALAYCGRHESSHHQGSHRFNEIQQEDYS